MVFLWAYRIKVNRRCIPHEPTFCVTGFVTWHFSLLCPQAPIFFVRFIWEIPFPKKVHSLHGMRKKMQNGQLARAPYVQGLCLGGWCTSWMPWGNFGCIFWCKPLGKLQLHIWEHCLQYMCLNVYCTLRPQSVDASYLVIDPFGYGGPSEDKEIIFWCGNQGSAKNQLNH